MAMLLKQVTGKSASAYQSLFYRAGVSLLLALYLVAFLFPPGSVPHIHDDQALHTGDACKKDACHIAIYHPGDPNGCHHKFHFTKAPGECPLCHSAVTRYLPLQLVVPVDIVFGDHPDYLDIAPGKGIYTSIPHTDRGPPFLV